MDLQGSFESVVESEPELLACARKAFQSYVRAYAAYSKDVKHIFVVRGLHLGHVAKSFGLRAAPTAVKVGGAKLAVDKKGHAGGSTEVNGAPTDDRTKGPPRKRMRRSAKTLKKLANSEFAAA